MHKLNKRRVIAIFMLAVFAMLAFAPRAAQAEGFYDPFKKDASAVKNGETITIYRHVKGTSNMAYGFDIIDGAGRLANARSSNNKVARAQLMGEKGSSQSLFIAAVGKGKAKVSFTYRGKRRTVNVVVKNYVNAFKTLKVGKTNITKKLNSKYFADVKATLARGKKLAITPKSGWKVKKIHAAMGGSFKNMKAGDTIPKKARGLLITMQNTKDKGCIRYQIGLQ